MRRLRLVIAGGAALAVSVMWPSAASAQLFNFEGSVVYNGSGANTATVFTLLLTGMGPTSDVQPPQQLADTGNNVAPSYSADGRQIFFGSDRTGSFQVWGMRFDGSNQTQLINQPGGASEPSAFPLPPDHPLLAITAAVGFDTEICTLDPLTGSTNQLTNNAVADNLADVSPDGQSIVWQQGSGDGTEVCTMGAGGQNQVCLTNNSVPDNRPRWTSDGKMIEWTQDGNVMRMNPDGSNQTQLTTGGNASNVVPVPGGSIFVQTTDVGPRVYGMGPNGENPGPLNGQDIAIGLGGGLDARPADSPDVGFEYVRLLRERARLVLEARVANENATLFINGFAALGGKRAAANSGAAVSASKKAKFKPATIEVSAGEPTKVKLKASRKARKAIAEAADDGDKLKVSVTITATDELGDVGEVTDKAKLKPKG
jgi:hypothetical protein